MVGWLVGLISKDRIGRFGRWVGGRFGWVVGVGVEFVGCGCRDEGCHISANELWKAYGCVECTAHSVDAVESWTAEVRVVRIHLDKI